MTGEELKEMRVRAGLSRTELGVKIGYTGEPKRINNRVYDFEVGRRAIGTATATLLRILLENQTQKA